MSILTRRDYSILAIYTVILLLDYFNFHLTEWVPSTLLMWLFAGVVLYSLNYKKYQGIDDEKIMKWQIISTVYIIVIIFVFYLLGGRTSAGLFFNEGMFIFILLLSLFEIFIRWRKWEV